MHESNKRNRSTVRGFRKQESPLRQLRTYLVWLPAMTVAAAIFYFSAQPADVSTEMSDGVTTLLLRMAEAVGLMELLPETVIRLCESLSLPVRKAAHVTEYLILYGTILFACFAGHDGRLPEQKRAWARRAFLLTVCYACTDEFHQLFVPGRAGRVSDVLIDSVGVAAVTWMLVRRWSEQK